MKEAHDLLGHGAKERDVHIVCCSEPNWKEMKEGDNWFTDTNTDAAIRDEIKNASLKRGRTRGIVWMDYEDFILVCCYISPNVNHETFESFLNDLNRIVDVRDKEIIIIGDFNAWSTVWGSRKTDKRGEAILDWVMSRNFTILNDGSPTFMTTKTESCLDLTICSRGLYSSIRTWKVVKELETMSDHLPILVELTVGGVRSRCEKPRLRRFKQDFEEPFVQFCAGQMRTGMTVEELGELTRKGCYRVMGVTRGNTTHRPAYWWNNDISAARKQCIKARRAVTRSRGCRKFSESDREILREEFRASRRALRKEILDSKRKILERQLEELNRNPWGEAYRFARGKCRPPAPQLSQEDQIRLARELFPVHEEIEYVQLNEDMNGRPFSEEELTVAVEKIKSGKAAGPDFIPPEITKILCTSFPQVCLEVFNECLSKGSFPDQWKIAALKLIPKSHEGEGPVKYRPICLTSTLGKVYEQLLQIRLRKECRVPISKRQFGFQTGKSTLDAITEVYSFGKNARDTGMMSVMVALDIKNAFNCVPWIKIDDTMERKGAPGYLRKVVRSYLTNRHLLVGESTIKITSGVPQGSVLGPLLWCMFYDEILEMKLEKESEERNVSLCCYADDLAILVMANNRTKLAAITNRVLKQVLEKLMSMGLLVAPEKTKAVLISSRRSKSPLTLSVGGSDVLTIEAMKYLGVWIQRDLRMTVHLEEAASKADVIALSLTRIMPNEGGPGQTARRIIAEVVYSTLLYAVQAWYPFMKNKTDLEVLDCAPRRILIRVCSGYRSMSTRAAEVIAGIPPLTLRAKEVVSLHFGENAKMARETTIMKWCQLWNEDTRGRWTHTIIGDLRRWLARKHGEVNGYLCQVLSGHGVFRAYLKKRNLSDAAGCIHCHEEDTVEHAVFKCGWSKGRRKELAERGVLIVPGTIVEEMIRSEYVWRAFAAYVKWVIEEKDV